MSKLFTLLLVLGTIVSTACEEKLSIGPSLTYRETFVMEGEKLVQAHKYVVNFPATGGTVDLKIVSWGIYNPESPSERFKIEVLDKLNSSDDNLQVPVYGDIAEEMPGNGSQLLPKYLQTLRITAQPNNSPKQQNEKWTLWTYSGYDDVARADILFRQAGKK